MSTTVRSSGPHIESRDTVKRAMWDVSIALIPVIAAAGIFFGPWALYLIFASAFATAIVEIPFVWKQLSWRNPLGDGSAFLAGLLFGLTLAPGSPWWIPIFGAVMIVVVAKQAFGGLGHNFFNPALVARAILLAAYPGLSTGWRVPLEYDAVTTATPLTGAGADYLELFLGYIPGSIGEVSALALLIGAAYLLVRGILGWRVTIGYLGAAVVTALILGVDPLFTILAGSIMFAALFMASDMVTSPVARFPQLIYGIGCGVLTVTIRELTILPEGTTYAVLIMNGLTPLINATVVQTFFGDVVKRGRRFMVAGASAAVLLVAVGVAFGTGALGSFVDSFYVDGTTRQDLALFFPGARHVHRYDSERDGVRVEQVFLNREPAGYLVYASEYGYKSRIDMVLALDTEDRIIGIRVADHNESATLGALVRRPSFLNQFLRRTTDNPDAVVDSLDVISGATVSSRAVATAVREALSFRVAPPAPAGRIETGEDGEYEGTGSGYNGRIRVQVTVEGGEVTAIGILSHSESPDIGEPALERISEAVIDRQSLDVDMVSGATGTSRGVIGAIRNALGD